MAYILGRDLDTQSRSVDDLAFRSRKWSEYQHYLESIANELPENTLAFAKATWRYDVADSQALHDSWVEHLIIREPSSGARSQVRSLEIEVRLLGPYHDGHTTLLYKDVKSYSLDAPIGFKVPPVGVGHGDWLVDEIRLSETGFVIHEVEFSRGGHWLIECVDIHAHWEAR